MERSLQELADFIDGRVIGDPLLRIRGLGTLETAGEGQITFLANLKYAGKVATTRASVVVCSAEANCYGCNAVCGSRWPR